MQPTPESNAAVRRDAVRAAREPLRPPPTWACLWRAREGFTLIELIVVIAIIATLAGLVAPAVFRNVGDAKVNAARSQVEMLALALNAYRLDNDAYPTTSEGLQALREPPLSVRQRESSWRGPYLARVLAPDPWGRPYLYVAPGVHNPASYDLYTLGRDGTVGGTGEDVDVTSWGGPVQP